MMSAKMATPCLVKLTVFWNKGYEDIVPASDVTDKILSSDSNYIADVSLWPRFDTRIWPEKALFCGAGLGSSLIIWDCIRYKLEILHHCVKRVRTKS